MRKGKVGGEWRKENGEGRKRRRIVEERGGGSEGKRGAVEEGEG